MTDSSSAVLSLRLCTMLTLQTPDLPLFPQAWGGLERLNIPLTKVFNWDQAEIFLSIKILKPYDFLSDALPWCKKCVGNGKKGKRGAWLLTRLRSQSASPSLVLMFSQEHTACRLGQNFQECYTWFYQFHASWLKTGLRKVRLCPEPEAELPGGWVGGRKAWP